MIVEFLQIQIPTDRISWTRTCATQMLTDTIIEICSTRLTTALRRPKAIILKLLYSYLRNRWHRTKINTSFSTWKELLTDVPQGSILGHLLFNIYLNDLFLILDMTDVCNYADDTELHSCDKELPCLLTPLEHSTALAIEWFEINYMKLNKDICHLLIAGHKYENLWVDVGGTKVWEENTQTMPGIQIENNLFFEKHVIGLCKRAGRKLSALKRLARILPFQKKTNFNSVIF